MSMLPKVPVPQALALTPSSAKNSIVIKAETEQMTIRCFDGIALEAVLLARTEDTMRLAVQGADDVMEVRNINGVWVSSDCEPVSIEFTRQPPDRKAEISEAECCCSRELASKLMHSLYTGRTKDKMEMETPAETPRITARCN